MKRHVVLHSLLIILLLFSTLGFSQESYMLKYNFVKGKTYLQTTQIVNNITQSMMGREMKQLSDITSNVEMNIEDVASDGRITMIVAVLDAAVHTSFMGKDTTIQLKDLKDKDRVVISSEGKTLSSTKINPSDSTGMMAQLKNVSKMQLLPGRLVKIGEKWQNNIVDSTQASEGNPFSTNISNMMEYSLIGKENKDGKNLLKIAYSGTLNITGKGVQMGMEMFMEGTGKTEGFLYFDPVKSFVIYDENNTEMDLSIAVTGPQNMTIPMTQSMKSVSKIEEKK